MNYNEISLYASIPFILMLGAIAILPLTLNHFWEKNKNKLIISIVLSIPVLIYLIINGFTREIVHTMLFDYVPFIILLGSLYTITGGILLTGDIEPRPSTNTAFLGIGGLLASFMGTTGAAMLLIRPVIQTNKERQYKVHTILFFIAIVANCGGVLTPLGDPPLFMMYLRGAPFQWFFNLYKEWALVNSLLLFLYFIIDSYYFKKENAYNLINVKSIFRTLKIKGAINFLFLLGVVLSVEFLNEFYLPIIKENEYYKFIREIVILTMAGLSLKYTSDMLRKENNFTWQPIEEVAYIFLGIFFTMIPTLMYLQSHSKELGVVNLVQFYYYTGFLSSFLDNTPTAVTFHSLALGLGVKTGNIVAGIQEEILIAISVASVFFGSMTYIGNGPNFMVKAIAEENKIKMPDFFSYIFKFSIIVLLPIFVLVQLIFIH
jgi:Na+/H+ antiporter NhaD/arsenite permease-like protein